MTLLQALVARGSIILTEHSNGDRDFTAVTEKILSKIPPNNSKLTYVWEDLLIHYVSESGIIYLTVAPESVGRRIPFKFLNELQNKFSSSYDTDDIENMSAYSLSEFNPTLEKLMNEYENDTTNDPLKQAKDDIGQVKDIMVKNVEQVLSRGERIDLLVDRTNDMSSQAFAFRKRSTVLRRQMWYKNKKIQFLTVFVGIIMIYLFIASFCGLGVNHC